MTYALTILALLEALVFAVYGPREKARPYVSNAPAQEG